MLQRNGYISVCVLKDPKMPPDKRHAYEADLKLKAISHALEHGNGTMNELKKSECIFVLQH